MLNIRTLPLLCALLGFASSTWAAETDVAVMPPQGASPEDATALLTELRTTLTLRSVTVADGPRVARIVDLGCRDLAVGCLDDVGVELATRRLVLTTLSMKGRNYSLDVALFDVATKKVTHAAGLEAPLMNGILIGARHRMLELLTPGSQTGALVVDVVGANGKVTIDGVEVPAGTPQRLSLGVHEVEVAIGTATPARLRIATEAETGTTLRFCAKSGHVVDDCTGVTADPPKDPPKDPPPTTDPTDPPPPPPLLLVAGSIGAGVGALGIGAGGIFAALSADAARRFGQGETKGDPDVRDQALGFGTASTVGFVAGGILLGAGAACIVTSLAMEQP